MPHQIHFSMMEQSSFVVELVEGESVVVVLDDVDVINGDAVVAPVSES